MPCQGTIITGIFGTVEARCSRTCQSLGRNPLLQLCNATHHIGAFACSQKSKIANMLKKFNVSKFDCMYCHSRY